MYKLNNFCTQPPFANLAIENKEIPNDKLVVKISFELIVNECAVVILYKLPGKKTGMTY